MSDIKEYSKAVLTHAISRARYEGRAEKEVAIDMGSEPYELSKYKSGTLTIPKNKLNRLIELYGHPRVAKGKYMEVELTDSIETYLNSLPGRIDNHTRSYLEDFFASSGIHKYMAESVSDEVLQPVEEDRTFNIRLGKMCKKENRAETLQWLEKRVSNEPFIRWSKAYENQIQHPRYQDRPDILKGDAKLISIKDDEWERTCIRVNESPLIYLFGYLKNQLQSTFSFTENKVVSGAKLKEVVLTGEVILDSMIRTPAIGKPHVLKIYEKAISAVNAGYGLDSFDTEEKLLKDRIKKVATIGIRDIEIKFFMNDELQYRILLTEDWGAFKTQVVIKNVKQDRILEQYNELCSSLGCEETNEVELKSAIASRGGFLPGAELL